ncbi:hypothetical protein ACAG96_00515 [Candidatus Izemoplasma sp. B36]|uniref:hypothetical protein n=1 Tax=Candidatus Izemoplasma sp. B36 TaxID=3242468 RepID=UPI0035587029
MNKKVYVCYDINNDYDIVISFINDLYLTNAVDLVATSSDLLFEDIEGVKSMINKSDLFIVLCGYHTNISKNVTIESEIAEALGKENLYINCRYNRYKTNAPKNAKDTSIIYQWSKENLMLLKEKYQ